MRLVHPHTRTQSSERHAHTHNRLTRTPVKNSRSARGAFKNLPLRIVFIYFLAVYYGLCLLPDATLPNRANWRLNIDCPDTHDCQPKYGGNHTTNAVLYATTFGSAVAGAENFIQQDIPYNRRNICAAQVPIGENKNLQSRAAGTCCASQAISQRLAGDFAATSVAPPHLFSLGDTERDKRLPQLQANGIQLPVLTNCSWQNCKPTQSSNCDAFSEGRPKAYEFQETV